MMHLLFLIRLRIFCPLVLCFGLFASCTAVAEQRAKLTSVGVTVIDLGNPYFVALGRGADAMAKVFGGKEVSVTIVSANNNLDQQVRQLEDFSTANTQLILLNAADSKGIAPAVKKARERGAIVVAVDVDVDAEGGAHATVTSDNKQAGEVAARYIVERLKGEGNVVILNGPPVTAVYDRVDGAMAVFARHPGIKVLSMDQNTGGNRMGGMKVMSELLAQHPKIDAVFAENDPSGVGADLAARQAQRKEFFIVGVDGSPEGEASLLDSESCFAATVAQNPYVIAAKAVEIGHALLQGQQPERTTTLIPVRLITRMNVGEYQGWTRK